MTAIVNETVSVKKKPSGRRVIFASAFGNALEFFDFGVYNFFVVYISTLFFPPSADHNVALLLAFATFGVSFLCARLVELSSGPGPIVSDANPRWCSLLP
ncbi:transporter transmembrane protein [Escherichia coli]|nr:transporter transmembrane protein [Escherichia coli]